MHRPRGEKGQAGGSRRNWCGHTRGTLRFSYENKLAPPSHFLCFVSAVQDSTQEKVHQYVRDNTARAWKAVEAIERGDAQGLGRVMAAAQVCARVWGRVVG